MTFLTRAYHGLLRFAFRLLYNEMAWSYDWVSWCVSLGQWRAWGRSTLPHLLGPCVLEIAFGTGDILLDLYANGFEVYGLDPSPYMAAIASRKLKKAGVAVPLVRGTAQAIPFIDGFFDSIVMTFPTAFVRDKSAWDEMARALRPGGRLVMVDRASLQRPKSVARLIEWLYSITGQCPEENGSGIEWFRQLGWHVMECERHLETSTAHLFVAERARPFPEEGAFP